MLALSNVTGDSFLLSEEILKQGFAAASDSPRKRIILPLHRTQDAPVQRMLNFFQMGTYVQPHVHPNPGQIETIQVIAGSIGFIVFEPDGKVRETHRLRTGAGSLIDIEPGLWHGMVPLEPDSAILEIKLGPYDPKTDKSFAPWAPAEGDPACSAYREKMESLFA